MNLDGITKKDIDEVRKGLALCVDLEQQIERGVACGLDCQELADRCNHARARLTKLNQVYGPQYPAKSSS